MSDPVLTDEEWMLLDGKCRDEVQARVELAHKRLASIAAHADLPPAQARFIADVVEEATREGLVICCHTLISRCKLCGTSKDYVPYKSGRYRGRPNHNKPRYVSGFEFAKRFIRMDGYPALGCCRACFDSMQPALKRALANVVAQVPDLLAAEGRPPWRRYQRTRCTKCEWTGHEGQLGKLQALMGGWYPGKCPSCGAENTPFGPTNIERVDGHEIVEVAA